jgi:hypothetical protein
LIVCNGLGGRGYGPSDYAENILSAMSQSRGLSRIHDGNVASMTVVEPVPVAHHSPEEARRALASLHDKDKTALMKVAKIYARTRQTRYDYDDLLHEAITRTLEGSRKWPVDVPFVAFICGVMRGIAWDWRNTGVTEADPEELTTGDESSASAAIDAKKLIALFADDPVAQQIVIGLMEGARGEDLWESTGLTKVDYESKRKKIRRRIEKQWLASEARKT